MATEPYKVVFIRHGESQFLAENRFCGWVDNDLAESGVAEAKGAAEMLKEHGFTEFDIGFVSVLKRAVKSLFYIQDELNLHWMPIVKTWRLNERHYGALQGLNKRETAEKYGEEQVKIWRRAYDVRPPPLEPSSPYWTLNDPPYKHLDKKVLPTAECLKDTVARVMSVWADVIVPEIKAGKRVLILAHGTSLRALVKIMDDISDQDITELNLPTGIPLVYELDPKTMVPIRHYFLASEERVKAAIEEILNQGKIKK